MPDFDGLIKALNNASTETAKVHNDLKREKRIRRWYGGIAAFGLAAALGIGVWSVNLSQEVDRNRREAQSQQCERTNEGRLNLRKAFDLLVTASQENNPQAKLPENQARANAFTAEMAKAFPLVDCKQASK